ncbi:MAG: UTP--glucose-1-phosphate uridylyltransferase [Deltaproteobacteria bacterium]|nr:UTP--glucose-1-phosphate uridylyltransferase [Deltaproteobacteria bacterium]
METLAHEIKTLPADLLDELARNGFEIELLLRLASRMAEDVDARNRLPGGVTAPLADDLAKLPDQGTAEHAALSDLGMQSLARGELAVVVLAGGMATRMGGVVKALVPALGDKTFLDLRLAENRHWSKLAAKQVPLWLMTSHATDARLREALGSHLRQDDIATFQQNLSVRLTEDGHLFREEGDKPSLYAPGHGDLPAALRRSGLLERFLARGGKYVAIANIDNLGATIDPAILGAHIQHRDPVTVEVVDKLGSDKGGIPVRWNGRRLILEEFRLPREFDPTTVRVFNTNTFLVTARALLDLDMEFTWVQVSKKVGDRKAVQFERLIGEITSTLATRFLHLPRLGAVSRFLPVKDMEELERRRPEIAEVAQARGMQIAQAGPE